MPLQVFVTCKLPHERALLQGLFPALRVDHMANSQPGFIELVVERHMDGAGLHPALNSMATNNLQVCNPRPNPCWSPVAKLHDLCSALPTCGIAI